MVNEEHFLDKSDVVTNDSKLIESESRFRKLLHDVRSVAIQGYDINGIITFWNEASEKLYGYKAEEAIGKNTLDLIIPTEIRMSFLESIKEMYETGEPIPDTEMILNCKDGSQVSVYSSHTIINLNGKTHELFCIDIDLTVLKKAQEKIRDNEQRYKSLFKTSPSGIMVVDENGVILEANEVISKMTLFTREELIGNTVMKIAFSEDEKLVKENIREIMSGKNKEQEHVNRRKDGTTFPIYLKETAITLPNGQKGVLSVSDDITERKQAEIELKKSEEKYRILFEANTDGIVILQRADNEEQAMKIIDMNENAAKLIGYTKKEILYKLPADFEKDIKKELQDRKIKDVLEKGQTSFETIIKHKDGHDINIEIKLMLINYDNQPALMNIIRDITERKTIEQELILSKEKAEESDRLKSAFLANMSHEIRTPMNGILGFAELLKQPMLTGEQQRHYINVIEKSGTRMINIINDIIPVRTNG